MTEKKKPQDPNNPTAKETMDTIQNPAPSQSQQTQQDEETERKRQEQEGAGKEVEEVQENPSTDPNDK